MKAKGLEDTHMPIELTDSTSQKLDAIFPWQRCSEWLKRKSLSCEHSHIF